MAKASQTKTLKQEQHLAIDAVSFQLSSSAVADEAKKFDEWFLHLWNKRSLPIPWHYQF